MRQVGAQFDMVRSARSSWADRMTMSAPAAVPLRQDRIAIPRECSFQPSDWAVLSRAWYPVARSDALEVSPGDLTALREGARLAEEAEDWPDLESYLTRLAEVFDEERGSGTRARSRRAA